MKMRTKKKLSKKLLSMQITPTRWAVLILIIAVVGTGIILWLVQGVTRTDAYIRDKNEIRSSIKSLLDHIDLPGKVLYSETEDDLCKMSYATGLAGNPVCTLSGYKFYKNSGNLAQNLHTAEDTLNNLGIERYFTAGTKDHTQENNDFELGLQGNGEKRTLYYRKLSSQNDFTGVYISYYYNQQVSNDENAASLISKNKITPPLEGEYLYGIKVQSVYFSCSQNCPTPPSPLRYN